MKNLLLSALLCGAVGVSPTDWEESIPALCGTDCLEDVSSEYIEHYRNLVSNPLDLNHSGIGKLKSAMLFSHYQIASLMDYMDSAGEIRSFTELSLINGFSPEFVSLISPFIEIRADSAPGERKQRAVRQEITARTDFEGYAAKYCISASDALSVSAGYTSNGSPTVSISANAGRISLVAGDFNARFGQGLTLWSGMTMSGASATGAERNPGGLCPSGSFSRGTRLRGFAASYDALKLSASICAGIDGAFAANAGYLWKSGQVGATALLCPSGIYAGADFKQKAGAFDLFGEISISPTDKCAAGLIGLQWSPEYLKKRYILLRYYPESYSNPLSGAFRTFSKCKDELGLSVSASGKALSATLDASYRPMKKMQSHKGIISYKTNIETNMLSLIPELRASIRYRPEDKYRLHSDIRADLEASVGNWSFSGRGNISLCRKSGLLGYLQTGYETGNFKTELRATVYNVKYWDDRIYVWQRDLPGSFNVPAFYGRGFDASIWCSYKKALYLRASYGICLREGLKKDFEIKLQYVKHLFHSRSARALDKHDRAGKRIGGKK